MNGRIQTGSYDDKDGKKTYTTDVVAQNVEFLEWGDSNQSNQSDSDDPTPEGFHPTDSNDIPF